VIRLAGTQHEALAVGARRGGRAEQLDVVDFTPVIAGDAGGLQALAYTPRVIGQLFEPVERERLCVTAHQEKPVAAPGHVAVHPANAGRLDWNLFGRAMAGHIPDGDTVLLQKPRLHGSADRIDADGAVADA